MLGLFAAGHWALSAWLHRRHPEMCDPMWEYRLARLEERLAESPGRPLVLVIGSSRVANGFSPRDMGDWRPAREPAPVVFNFATLGAGPVRELLTLRRLLAHGIRPDYLFVEVWPPFWGQRDPYCEKKAILETDLHLSDLPVLEELYDHGWEGIARVCAQGLPLVHNRTLVLHEYAPSLIPPDAAAKIPWTRLHWMTLDAHGWLPVLGGRPPEASFAASMGNVRRTCQPILDDLEVTDLADRATRALLRECADQGIWVALLYMPEHSALRSWYPPRTRRLIADYLGRLRAENGVPVIDTRDWVGDEGFQDFSHMQDTGARVFSGRFGPEVLRPLLEGAPLPAHAALHVDIGPESSGGASPADNGPVAPGP
jgi:hypothetical protein